MDEWENKLTAKLYRALCPDSAELGEYQLGLLAGEPRARIQNHLTQCPLCAAEVRTLQGFLDDNARDLTLSFGERVSFWVAERLSNPSGGALTPAFGLRGGEQPGPLLYQAGDTLLTLEIQDDPAQSGHKSLLGLVTGAPPDGRLQAGLYLQDQLVQTNDVDELGNFGFDKLEPGVYQLLLNGSDIEIQVNHLQI